MREKERERQLFTRAHVNQEEREREGQDPHSRPVTLSQDSLSLSLSLAGLTDLILPDPGLPGDVAQVQESIGVDEVCDRKHDDVGPHEIKVTFANEIIKGLMLLIGMLCRTCPLQFA